MPSSHNIMCEWYDTVPVVAAVVSTTLYGKVPVRVPGAEDARRIRSTLQVLRLYCYLVPVRRSTQYSTSTRTCTRLRVASSVAS